MESSPDNLHIFDYASPIGNLRGVISAGGLVSLSLDRGNLGRICESDPGNSITARYFHELTDQLDRFFGRDLDIFSIDLDTSDLTDFQRRIYRELKAVPFGSLITYGELGRLAGVEAGARAVGGAMGRNPYLLVVPCHRVVSAGSAGRFDLGGFSAGLDVKRYLLSFEGSLSGIGSE